MVDDGVATLLLLVLLATLRKYLYTRGPAPATLRAGMILAALGIHHQNLPGLSSYPLLPVIASALVKSLQKGRCGAKVGVVEM